MAVSANGLIMRPMTLLQALRHSRLIARSVLAWFVLSMAVAVAAPVVQPHTSVLVCSASGAIQLVDASSDDGVAQGRHTLDCVLCLALHAAPPVAVDLAALPKTTSGPVGFRALAPVAYRSDATLAARAPPALI